MSDGNWLDKAQVDALEMAEEFLDELIETAAEADGEIPKHFGAFPRPVDERMDAYHHESHVDKSYSLLEAAELLDDLSDYEETDWGLWEGSPPKKAITIQAAYTYGNAVSSLFSDLLEKLSDGLRSTLDLDPEPEDGKLKAWCALYLTAQVKLPTRYERADNGGMVGAALDDLDKGDTAGLYALCDLLTDGGTGEEHLAKEMRELLQAWKEAPEGEEKEKPSLKQRDYP